MNLADIIVIAVLAACVLLEVRAMRKKKKRGGGCSCGCDRCNNKCK